MKMMSSAITGNESEIDIATPYGALVEFYRAFNHRNLALMEKNWDRSDAASMSNPLGGVRRGWREIQPVYLKIFTGPAEVYVEFYDYSIHQTDNMFCAVGRERGHFRKEGIHVELAIRTSRVYHLTQYGWRQLHHHGSIDNAELLAKYQAAVLGEQR